MEIKPIIREAIFSDGTENYRIPQEPMEYDEVRVRLRVAKNNIEQAYVAFPDRKVQMNKITTETYFDFYEAVFWLEGQVRPYYFIIKKGEEIVYYNHDGVVETIDPYYNFRIIPGYKTPGWAKGAVFYQIFVDRFANGNRRNNVETGEYVYINEPVTRVDDWSKYPATMGIREFYGGDLQGVMNKLDYLQELGVEVLYLNPIFVSPSNHKYDTQDYDYIDPHFTVILEDGGDVLRDGDKDNSHATKYIKRVTDVKNLEASNRYFANFVKEVHRRGMKVILDGVFNHCGSFNKWLDRECIYETNENYQKGAFVDGDSPYRSFFKFRKEEWPYNRHYDGWWGHDTLPKLNYEESSKLFDYIMRIAKKWVSPPYNVDGWRLDVAADLGYSLEYNHQFWKEFRRVVKEANPEALILAEHYGDVSPWLSGGEWDGVMNYDAFMEPITWFLTGMEKHSDVLNHNLIGNTDVFWRSMKEHTVRFLSQSVQVSMNELSNHDHSRFLTRTNQTVGRVTFMKPEDAGWGVDRARMMAAVTFQMTWVGAPTVYYGDEAGVCGWTDPDNRRTYPWGDEDKELIRCHKELIRIHKDYDVFRNGSTVRLSEEKNVLAYARFAGGEVAIVAIYIGNQPREIELPIWRTGLVDGDIMVRLASTGNDGFSLETDIIAVKEGLVTLMLQPNSSVIWKRFMQ